VNGWTSIREARRLPGLRLVLLRGFPSPWSQAARALFELKGIPFAKVHRSGDDLPGALLEWTGQESFPAAIYEDERPRTGWAEILLLAERLGERPPMIPPDEAGRVLMFGLAHEILGEMGLVWCRRLIGMQPHFETRPGDPDVRAYRHRYGSSAAEVESAAQRVAAVLEVLSEQLARQRAIGREFMVGGFLSAVDVYWAVSSNLFAPLAEDLLPLPAPVRATVVAEARPLQGALHPLLIEHRDGIYRRFLRLPIEL